MRPHWVEMKVPYELQEVGLHLHHDGLVPVLEEVAAAVMVTVEGEGVARGEAPHKVREAGRARPERQVGVVGGQGSGVGRGPGRDSERPDRAGLGVDAGEDVMKSEAPAACWTEAAR